MAELQKLLLDLVIPVTREIALLELSKKREAFTEFAPILWRSFGTVEALLQEIISIRAHLSFFPLPPSLKNLCFLDVLECDSCGGYS